jgi:hypothetical protein
MVFPVGNIEIYDPAHSPADVKACFDLGVRVLLVNEQCQRIVKKPTLFYVPGLKFIGNLVESNFSPKQLNKVILVSYGLKYSVESAYGAFENWNRGCTSRCLRNDFPLLRANPRRVAIYSSIHGPHGP